MASTTQGGPDIVRDGLAFMVDARNHRSRISETRWDDVAAEATASVFNATINSDKTAYDFDGSLTDFSYAEVDTYRLSHTDATRPYTISVWFNARTAGPQNNAGILTQYITNNTGARFGVRLNTFTNEEGFQKYIAWWHGSVYRCLVTLPSFGEWYNITYTRDTSGTITGRLNVDIHSNTTTYQNTFVDENMRIAIFNPETASVPFDGEIGIVQIYERVLTVDEIRQNFNALKHRYGL